MKVVIGHLFNDLLNLYGESGNILALKHAIESQGFEVEIRNLSLDSIWNTEDIDFLYIGTGTETNQKIALETMKKYKEKLKEHIEKNKFFLVTGNSIELFGEYILNNGKKEEALGLFNYYTERTDKRQVLECIYRLNGIESEILGFQNNEGKTINSKSPIFKVEKEYGMEKDKEKEGFMYKNFYATYLLGPLLARNPDFLEELCKSIILSKNNNFEFKPFDFEIEKEAHKRYLKKYETLK